MPEDLANLESKLGYTFTERKILEEALTHRSVRVVHEDVPHHQRLQFLGDAVLFTVISEYLFLTNTTASSGTLSMERQLLVSADKENEMTDKLEIHRYVEMGPSLPQEKFRRYGEFVKAVIGAVFVDGGGSDANGLKKAKKVVLKLWNLEDPTSVGCAVT